MNGRNKNQMIGFGIGIITACIGIIGVFTYFNYQRDHDREVAHIARMEQVRVDSLAIVKGLPAHDKRLGHLHTDAMRKASERKEHPDYWLDDGTYLGPPHTSDEVIAVQGPDDDASAHVEDSAATTLAPQ